MERHGTAMQRALELAGQGRGRVRPNPLVGAVITRDGHIIGEGAHQQYGGPHAEINALHSLSGSADGATMYVNLEPCTYDGKTPPCVPAIIEAGIARVVVGMQDPNPKVNGQGIRQLREAGIEVITGILEQEATELNRGFVQYMRTGYPWVTLKLALTIDGFMADGTGNSRWITGSESRERVHRWRAEHDAILVGSGTIQADDPMLTVRETAGPNPLRVVVDPRGEAPADARVFTDRDAETVVITSTDPGNGQTDQVATPLILSPDTGGAEGIPWEEILRTLVREKQVLTVFVEGGAGIASSLLASGFVNELIIMTGPKILGRGLSPFHGIRYAMAEADLWRVYEVKQFENDVCIRYRKE